MNHFLSTHMFRLLRCGLLMFCLNLKSAEKVNSLLLFNGLNYSGANTSTDKTKRKTEWPKARAGSIQVFIWKCDYEIKTQILAYFAFNPSCSKASQNRHSEIIKQEYICIFIYIFTYKYILMYLYIYTLYVGYIE